MADSTDENARFVYSAIQARRQHAESLLWQVPPLALTALAFLMSSALSSGNDPGSRIVASSLAAVVSLLVILILYRSNWHFGVDRHLLAQLDKEYGLVVLPADSDHAEALFVNDGVSLRAERVGSPHPRLRERIGAFELWVAMFTMFGLVSLAMVPAIALGAL